MARETIIYSPAAGNFEDEMAQGKYVLPHDGREF